MSPAGPNGNVFIVSAARTPIGKFAGALADTPATTLGGIAIRAAVERAGIPNDAVDEVLMGQVLQAGVGQAPARQALLKGGLANTTSATTINRVCGSGLKAIMLGAAEIRAGDAEDRKSTRLNSSHLVISYAVFCLKKKKKNEDNVFRKWDKRCFKTNGRSC